MRRFGLAIVLVVAVSCGGAIRDDEPTKTARSALGLWAAERADSRVDLLDFCADGTIGRHVPANPAATRATCEPPVGRFSDALEVDLEGRHGRAALDGDRLVVFGALYTRAEAPPRIDGTYQVVTRIGAVDDGPVTLRRTATFSGGRFRVDDVLSAERPAPRDGESFTTVSRGTFRVVSPGQISLETEGQRARVLSAIGFGDALYVGSLGWLRRVP